MNACAVCGKEASASERVCPRCQPLIPRSLLEACGECGEGGYRAGLADGTQIPFEWAIISGNWVTLGRDGGYDISSHGHSFPRGVDIRLATIVWCARDPDGLEEAEPAA